MTLDPTVRSLIEAAKASGRPPFSRMTPAETRKLLVETRAAYGTGPDIARVEDLSVPTRSGSVPARVFADRDDPIGLVVYFHGGGWVFGSPEEFDGVGRLLAQRSGCAVLMPDYRLAPETPFPGALEDATDTILWASAHGADLAGRPVPLVVAGDSAGGNLAAVATAELRGQVSPCLQMLIYPVTNSDFETPSYRDPDMASVITREDMIWFFGHYLRGQDGADPRISPLRRQDLAGVPPAHLVLAGHDVLRSDGEAYAAALQAAGVPTTTTLYPTMPHGFIRFYNLVPDAKAGLLDIAGRIGSACRLAAIVTATT